MTSSNGAVRFGSCGVLAAMLSGATPVWVGFLSRGGTQPSWDFQSARYADDAGWTGQIVPS